MNESERKSLETAIEIQSKIAKEQAYFKDALICIQAKFDIYTKKSYREILERYKLVEDIQADLIRLMKELAKKDTHNDTK